MIFNDGKSLQLFNDDDTPGQIEYFFHFYSLTNLYPQLKSLSILKIKVKDNYNTLLDQLQSLTNLNSLTIESIYGTTMSNFSLPKLKRLVVRSCRNTKWITDLSHLKTFEYTLTSDCFCQADLILPLTLKRLKIIYVKDEDLKLVQQSLTYLSQLITLEIYQKERGQSYPDGQVWEELIRSSLPLLKNFQFYFQFEYVRYSFNQVHQIVASFYVLEKSWFVLCDLYQRFKSLSAIYTVPFAFDRFTIFTNSFDKSISTYFNDNNNTLSENMYANVKTLGFEENLLMPDESLNRAQIVNLVLKSHFDSINWIHLLTKLRHLEITSDTVILLEHFRLLLDNTPYLYSLVAEKNILRALTENWRNVFICNHLSYKIRSLKLYSTLNRSQYLSRNELQQIIRIFASKCQHLSLSIQSANNTIGLILRNMSQLRSLHVNIMEKIHQIITMEWLDQQQTKYNQPNCVIDKEEPNYYFWLGIHP